MEVEAYVAIDGGSLVVVLAGPVLLLDGAVAVVETGASSPGRGTMATTAHLLPMSPPDLMTPHGGMRLRWASRRWMVGSGCPRARDLLDLLVRVQIARSPTPCVAIKDTKVNQVTPSNVHDPCLICKSREHVPAFCAQAFCERCGRLVKGETSTRQMELDLNDYLATGWRCLAHAIGPGVFVVRFPNPRVEAQICYVGRIVLKPSGAVINVTKWSSAVGSKGVMEVACVKVSNVPLDKRSEGNMAYVASLVGVPLEIDSATLHYPASTRVKVGCRNVDDIPSVAEAVLGEHFYDFYFEADQVLVRDPNRGEFLLSSGKSNDKEKNDDVDTNKNKKPRIDEIPTGAVEEKMIMCRLGEKEQIQESQESLESDVSLHTSLLIDSMTMEFMEEEKHVMDAELGECDAGKVEYMVESTDTAVEVEVIPTPPLATEENLRFSLRNVQSKMDDVQLKAAAAVKKRNVEGILHLHNSFDALSNPNMVLVASKMGVIIPDNDFVNIDVIRELEKFRNNNSKAEREGIVEAEENMSNMTVINANGVVTPLDLSWMEEGNIEEDDFTLVRSRKKNKLKNLL
ncbi:hypothetical protein D1007_59944 [Hordeum vulgare]|nr:hypothetical protein D1007_59944 [Hordeum vulgare]